MRMPARKEWRTVLGQYGSSVLSVSRNVVGQLHHSWTRVASGVAGHRICRFMLGTRDVHHLELVAKGFLFEVSQARVGDAVKRAVAKQTKQRLMISGHS